MSAIADASGDISTTWPWPVVIFAIAVAAVIYGFYAILTNPVPPLDPQETDTADPAPCDQPCVMRCGLTGTITRLERDDLGGRPVAVCPGHSDEGDRRDW